MTAQEEMARDMGLEESSDWRPAPGQVLFTGSVEKNSRGYTWKVSAGHEGVPLSDLLTGLREAVDQMIEGFGGPDNGK